MIKFCDLRATIIITIGVVCNFSILIVTSLQTFAAPLNNTPVSSDELQNESQNSSILIEFETSRPRMTIGSSMGIIAKITNTSDKPVMLREDSLRIILPPEMNNYGDSYNALNALFNTERHPNDQWATDKCIEIQSKESYRAIWGWGKSQDGGGLYNELIRNFHFTFFEPGNYAALVNVKYWTDPTLSIKQCNKLKNTDLLPKYRLYTKTVSVTVDSPQPVIMFGAIIGGIISWGLTFSLKSQKDINKTVKKLEKQVRTLEKEVRNSQSSLSGNLNQLNLKSLILSVIKCFTTEINMYKYMVFLLEISGALLLSAIVTILLSRMSDAKFLINVTVNDFWGAIATGFVASYFGTPLLEQFKPKNLVGDNDTDEKPALVGENAKQEKPALVEENGKQGKPALVEENAKQEKPALVEENGKQGKPALVKENGKQGKPALVEENGKLRENESN